MKRLVKNIIMILLLSNITCFAAIKIDPENIIDRAPNEFYINYHSDRFNDEDYSKPYIVNESAGKYTWDKLKVYNQDMSYTIKYDKFSDANRFYFGIISLLWGDKLFDNYFYKVSVKYNNQVYDYPNKIQHYKSTLIIDQINDAPLHDLLYNLLVQGTPFKLRIDETTIFDNSPATHIIEIVNTNFAEAFVFFYSLQNK